MEKVNEVRKEEVESIQDSTSEMNLSSKGKESASEEKVEKETKESLLEDYTDPQEVKDEKNILTDETMDLFEKYPHGPVINPRHFTKFIDQWFELTKGGEKLQDLNDKEREAYNKAGEGTFHSLYHDIPSEIYNQKGTFTNNLKNEDKGLGIEYLKMSQTPSSKLNSTKAMMRFKSLLGVGRPVSVNLFHSGFTIRLRPASIAALTTLELNLYDEEAKKGKSTLGLSVSADKIIVIETFSRFIREHYLDGTLNIPADKNIMDYISILDLDTILLAILHSTNLNKIPLNRICSNLVDIDPKAGTVGCNHTITALVDPSKLLFVNKDRLTREMLAQVSHTSPDILTLEEYENYQKELTNILKKEKLIQDSYRIQSINVDLNLSIPTVNEYIAKSQLVIEEFNHLVDQATKSNDEVSVDMIKDTLASRFVLADYMSVIKNLTVFKEDIEESLQDPKLIMDILEELTKSDAVRGEIIKEILRFYNNSLIAIIALPNYTCPSCKKDQIDTSKTPGFEDEFIPLNMTSFFAYLDPMLRQ